MKNSKVVLQEEEADFKAVEFMRSARKRMTEKYQKDRTAFLSELEQTTNDFLKLRKKKNRKAA